MGTTAPYAGNALTFLVTAAFGFYLLVLMLRVLLQLVGANYYNPLSQFVVNLTEPVLAPLRRIAPRVGGIEGGALLAMVALQMLEIWLLYQVRGGGAAGVGGLPLSGLLVFSVAELLELCVDVFFWSVLIRVVLSWVNPGFRHPINDILLSLTEPVLAPARRMLPAPGGIDFSPVIVLIGLRLVTLLLIDPLRDAGGRLLF